MLHWRWLVNSVNFKSVRLYTKLVLFSFFFFAQIRIHALEIDLSRRQTSPTKIQNIRLPASVFKNTNDIKDSDLLNVMKNAVNPVMPETEIVILNTEKGFVPEKLYLKLGSVYNIHVVNVNVKVKNSSFLMDSFTQSHNTSYGDVKDFVIVPKAEGVFSYQCPETGFQGKVIVVPEADQRKPASQD